MVLDDEDELGRSGAGIWLCCIPPRSSYSLNASMEPVFIIVLGVMPFRGSILS